MGSCDYSMLKDGSKVLSFIASTVELFSAGLHLQFFRVSLTENSCASKGRILNSTEEIMNEMTL